MAGPVAADSDAWTSDGCPPVMSARAMSATPLSSPPSRSVAWVRNPTQRPESLTDGWSEGPLPACPEGVADTRRVLVCSPLYRPRARVTENERS